MTLDGAIHFHETDSYTIYTMNSITTGQYCVVLPKNINGTLNMLVDLHMKTFFDELTGGTKTKEQLIAEIDKEYVGVRGKYANGILVFPMMVEDNFKNAVSNHDKQKMFDETKKIGAITSEIYKKLTDSGVDKQGIEQKIIMIEKNDDDIQFVNWLKEQMPNFVDGVSYNDVCPKLETVNPFMNPVSSVTPNLPEMGNHAVSGAASNTTSVPSGNSIFDNVSSNSVSAPTNPSVATNSVPSTNVDIFGIPLEKTSVTTESVQEPTQVSVSQEVQPSVFDVGNPVVSEPISTPVETPKPVNPAELEGTTTFRPIAEPSVPNASSTVEPVVATTDESNGSTPKGSKGFANLAILFVILVGVTIASIELGKFLYNVYGK